MQVFKKGQNTGLNQIISGAVFLAIAILVLTLFTQVNSSVQTAAVNGKSLEQITNESVTWTNGSYVALSTSGASVTSLICNSVYNNVSGSPTSPANISIVSGNWSCGVSGINVTDFTSGNAANITTTVRVVYSFSRADYEYNTTANGLAGTINLSAQFGNIGTVIAIAVIVLLLLGVMALFVKSRE